MQQPLDDCTKELGAQTMKLNQFWSDLRPLLDSGPPDSKLHDVAQLSTTVTDRRPPFDKQDPDAAVSLAMKTHGFCNLKKKVNSRI